ncbi:hypothetical protein ACTWP5_11110 [Streptomyces sp. 4N509B]|uniref:hypothetical protein n=1 Tax=Streptomyces sp. 4N509B TaxID=3457413 RepID=UPI003FD49D09
MPNWSDVKPVPDWFGWEDQGAGVALGNISGRGDSDMLVFHIDNPAGENHGYYRIGWNIQGDSSVTGWSDVKPIPGWFGAEDQGAGVTLGDVNRNGRQDMLVFHLDNPGGDNHGYYRIGWDLDPNGNVGAWSDIKAVPDWFGWENQGAGVALADINGSGRQDLLVFHVDNPGGDNHGYYRIGWDLDDNGNVAGWSDIKPVPGWFGWENQGAGVALGNINNNGRMDMAVFHVDNPGGDNHGYYRIGWDLDANGNVAGWSDVKPVPGWFGWENQGADVALWDIAGNGGSDMLVFHVDNPGGDNHGHYRIGWDLEPA